MTASTELAPGFFCWVDVAVADPGETHKFFTELFGWGRRVRPTEDAHAYSIMTAHGHHVAGICEVEDAGPSQWMSYLLVDDLEVATAKAQHLGGQILKADITIATFGKMSVVEDPSGAVFALWQSLRGETEEPRGHGSVCWNELLTNDVEKAKNFYTQLVGWNHLPRRIGGLDYHLFRKNEKEVCGMLGLDQKAEQGSVWRVYFTVDDCDEAARKVEELGGKVVQEPSDLEGVGRCALVRDPGGGIFGLLQS